MFLPYFMFSNNFRFANFFGGLFILQRLKSLVEQTEKQRGCTSPYSRSLKKVNFDLNIL
ncbi:hypothetical protein HanPI659440_Chr04g0149101 [Helianthus annuus]|nr:hypothetical protein HanPI659440_Chr04g0149101 [Helianthus annuus]